MSETVTKWPRSRAAASIYVTMSYLISTFVSLFANFGQTVI